MFLRDFKASDTKPFARWFQLSHLFSLLLLCASGFHVSAQVIFFDGFGDADLNNNGIPLEPDDVDVAGIGVTQYSPPEFPGSTVNIVTTVEDASDTGLRWLSSRGFTSSGDPRADIKIVDDSSGVFPETPDVPALNTGLALSWNSRGRGSSATAFFDRKVELGPLVGDWVKVGFDFRTWLSSPNQNTFTPAEIAELRFGLFEDTDNQLGMSNSFAGPPDPITGIPAAAVWGQEHGQFRGDLDGPGANGDHGWYTRIELGDPSTPFAPDPGGLGARINEELNEPLGAGDTSTPRFLEGADNDLVARPSVPDFVSLDSTQPYRPEFALERATEVMPGDTIRAIYDVTNLVTGESWSLSGQESLMMDDGSGNLVPDGISSDSWDYFGIRNTGSDDFDFLLDNFTLEAFGGGPAVTLDLNGDDSVDCADVDSLVAEIASIGTDVFFDLDGNGTIDRGDLDLWLSEAGDLLVGGAFLPGDGDLNGFVDIADFNVWISNRFTSTPAWCSGDFNADGAVDISDFNIWNEYKFTSSTDIVAVPEPSTATLLALAAIFFAALQTRRASEWA